MRTLLGSILARPPIPSEALCFAEDLQEFSDKEERDQACGRVEVEVQPPRKNRVKAVEEG